MLLYADAASRRPARPSPDYLLNEGLEIIDRALKEHRPTELLPLFSGGDDSACACHVASQHSAFGGTVYQIDTGIGSRANREHADRLAAGQGWTLERRRSKDTYEQFVRDRGFPGPGRHHWVYARIKERVIKAWVREKKVSNRAVGLLTGCRKAESARRLGSAEPIKRGTTIDRRNGRLEDPQQLWIAPIVYWTKADKYAYMEEWGLPANPLKSTLNMSGECFCGAFARPGELETIRRVCPDVAAEIDRLAEVARECGTPDRWGESPPAPADPDQMLLPLCQSCPSRAGAGVPEPLAA